MQSMATKNWTRVDNIFAMANTEESVVICDTDLRQRGPGTDHVPILTMLDISVPKVEEEGHRNFRTTDWDRFRQELEAQLGLIPGPCTLINESQFQKAVDNLTVALQKTIEAVVPLSRPSPHSHRWWSKELSQLKKEINQLASHSYKFRAIGNHPSHDSYKRTHTAYGDAIKRAKEQHWKDFLKEIEGKELWTAHKYVTSPVGDGGKARILTLQVVGENGMTRNVDSNKEKSEVLRHMFFPAKPVSSLLPEGAKYPNRVTYSFWPSMAQL